MDSGSKILRTRGALLADLKKSIARFDGFEFDLRAGELHPTVGAPIRLSDQPCRILTALLKHPGEVVFRDEIRKALWPNDTVVEFEHSINAAMKRLRQALGDTAENPRYIETLARRGYRWIGPVEWVDSSSAQPDTAARLVPAGPDRWWILVTSIAVCLAFANAAVYFTLRRPSRSNLSSDLKMRQLTFNSQEKGQATGSVSPDGKYLAYSDADGVHLQLIETGESHILEGFQIEKADWEVAAWFPDSARFVVNAHAVGEDQTSWSSQGSSVWLASVLGTEPHKLRDNAYAYSVSPDGSAVSFGTNKGRLGDREIWLMDANGEHARKLFYTGEDSTIGGLVWSPDGRWTVYQIQDDFGTALLSRKLNGGPPSTVLPASPSNNGTEYLWLPEGRLIYIAPGPWETNGGNCTFWQIRLDQNSGHPLGPQSCAVYWPATHISDISITLNGKHLAFRKLTGHNTTYVADLNANGTGITKPRHFTLTDSVALPLGWTLDSKALIIGANRAGEIGIYRQALDKETATLVVPAMTDFHDVAISPDGNWTVHIHEKVGAKASISTEAEVLRSPVDGGPSEFVAKVKNGSLLRCARSPAALCVIAEPSKDRKQVVISAFDPLKGMGAELVRFNPDSITNAWDLDLSPDGTRIAALPSPKGPLQVLHLNGEPTEEIRLKDWHSMHTVNWASNGKTLLLWSGNLARGFPRQFRGSVEQSRSELDSSLGIPRRSSSGFSKRSDGG
jgi:DNA-binding winged helix-turn-helix (wHTH) protein/Tol biopolymer transport system component